MAIAAKGVIEITGNRKLVCLAYIEANSYLVYSRILLVRPSIVYYLVSIDVVIVR